MSKFNLPYPIGDCTEFNWGPVVDVHSVSVLGVDLVEYHPQIFEDCRGTGLYDMTKVSFYLYQDGKETRQSFSTPDAALVHAIAIRKYGQCDASNNRLSRAAMKLLDLSD